MNEPKLTIGRAIDQIVEVLGTFEERVQRTILSAVCAHLELTPVSVSTLSVGSSVLNIENPEIHPLPLTRESKAIHGLDIRMLKDQKQPTSARQMACLVAYYLQEHAPVEEQKQVISTADLEKYFKQAGFRLPSKLEQVLVDCKKSGYFESSSRGEYKLTRVGYNLVTHSLPMREKV